MKMLLISKRDSSINIRNIYKYFVFLFISFAFFSLNNALAADDPCAGLGACYPGGGTVSDVATQCPSAPQYDCDVGEYCDAKTVLSTHCCRSCPTVDETECGKKDLQLCCFNTYTSTVYCEDSSLECRYVEEFSKSLCRPKICGDDNQTCCTYSSLACDSGISCSTQFKCAPEATVAPPPLDNSVFDLIKYDGPIIDNLPALLSPVFKLLFYVGIFIGILGIIYSGYLLMVSEGDPGKAKEGKEQFTAAILGSLFILLSVVILRAIINSILGVNSGL